VIADLFSELETLGITTAIDQDQVVLRGQTSALTPELRSKIVAHKPAILAELRARQPREQMETFAAFALPALEHMAAGLDPEAQQRQQDQLAKFLGEARAFLGSALSSAVPGMLFQAYRGAMLEDGLQPAPLADFERALADALRGTELPRPRQPRPAHRLQLVVDQGEVLDDEPDGGRVPGEEG
jgi:hypothetical protein